MLEPSRDSALLRFHDIQDKMKQWAVLTMIIVGYARFIVVCARCSILNIGLGTGDRRVLSEWLPSISSVVKGWDFDLRCKSPIPSGRDTQLATCLDICRLGRLCC